MTENPFAVEVTPDWTEFVACIKRQGRPGRVHNIELFLDGEVQAAICGRFGLLDGLDEDDSFFQQRKEIRLARFLGYDYVRGMLDGMEWKFHNDIVDDTAAMARQEGRSYINLHAGPITNWDEFERYPWPNPAGADTRWLEWYEKNLPDDMCMIGWGVGHYAEFLSWLMGYETLCYALHDNRGLVEAIASRLISARAKS